MVYCFWFHSPQRGLSSAVGTQTGNALGWLHPVAWERQDGTDMKTLAFRLEEVETAILYKIAYLFS